jgi:hypothetical protein
MFSGSSLLPARLNITGHHVTAPKCHFIGKEVRNVNLRLPQPHSILIITGHVQGIGRVEAAHYSGDTAVAIYQRCVANSLKNRGKLR